MKKRILPFITALTILLSCIPQGLASQEAAAEDGIITYSQNNNANTPPFPVADENAAEISEGETYSAALDTLFTDEDTQDALTYKVSVNGGENEEAEQNYTFTPDTHGTYTLVFTANDGVADSTPYTLTLTVKPYTEITIPSESILFVGENLRGSWSYNYFLPFKEYIPAKTQDNGDGTTTYFYNLTDNSDSNIFNYRISGESHITYAGKFVKTDGFAMTVTAEDLTTEGKTKAYTDKNPLSNNGYNDGNIYLNINKSGHLIMEEGETYQIVPLRRWEIVDTTENNYIIEPDFHYSVTGDAVTVDENGLITAAGEGSAIVMVTYDAINVNGFDGGPFFGAIYPENTGVFVVTVGNSSEASEAELDSELDVVYFTGESGSYTIAANEAVQALNPLTDTEFSEVAPNGDGTVTLPLTQGRNIIKIGNSYRVITAKKLSYTVNGGEEVKPGDEISIAFNTVYSPVSKLAGVYNPTTAILYTTPDGKTAGSKPSSYTFASDADSQTVRSLITRTEGEEWGCKTYSYSLSEALKVPDDYSLDTYTLTGGTTVAYGYGDPFGNHRGITYEAGKAPNDNYDMKEGFFGILPDIEIPITATSSPISSITADAEAAQTEYFAGDAFNRENLIITAQYEDGTTQIATNYTAAPEILTEETTQVTITYRGKTTCVPVTVTPLEVTEITLTSPPSKTSYLTGETFNPTGMVIAATYNNGKTEPTTDYTYSPTTVLSADDTEITVTYNGNDGIADVVIPITVTDGGSSGSSDTISVYFTLMGDSKHGEGGGEHTLKDNNLTTWISKRLITVASGSRIVDVLTKALSLSGIPYSCPSGAYIESIKGLKEFDNGSTSGWMYTVNGTHPTQGIDKKTVRNGDVIIFHYTDNYTVERSADTWQGGSSSTKKPTVKEEEKKEEVPVEHSEKPVLTETTFADVKKDDWHYESVKFVYENGLMEGTENGFEPDMPMSRAMLLTVLYRMSEEAAKGASGFSDVKDGEWYADAVAWAAENGIASGTGNNMFSPDLSITREQTAAILYRYAQYKKISITENSNINLSDFEDFQSISDYSEDALLWAVKSGIIQGVTQTLLLPDGYSTRAQIATILMRFSERK